MEETARITARMLLGSRRAQWAPQPPIIKKLYGSIADLQADLDHWLEEFNRDQPHQERWCFGKTPLQTFLDAKPIAEEKMIAA